MASSSSSYANVTLTSQDGDLAIVLYLPVGIKRREPTFYYGSRFDHGSMVGSIIRNERYEDGSLKKTHVLYGTDQWRIPHNSHWPESGVGLAAEFGVGDNGAFCFFHCGWQQSSDITNGLLGYIEAKNGEPFLKIGVGALIKGTCPTCDSTGDYKFNSPYLFWEEPQWTMDMEGDSRIRLHHEARLHQYGYRLEKEIFLDYDTLLVRTTLVNLGSQPFSTVWYSHNFFTCDSEAVGPGYELEMDLRGDHDPLYEEPGTWSWSTPLLDYARIVRKPESIRVAMQEALNPGIRIKAEFLDDGQTNGGFTINACGSSIRTTIPEMELVRIAQASGNHHQDMTMYAYNLYVERGTFSPEPQILMRFQPGVPITWTQRLVIGPSTSKRPSGSFLFTSTAIANLRTAHLFSPGIFPAGAGSLIIYFITMVVAAVVSGIIAQRMWMKRQRRSQYHAIPDSSTVGRSTASTDIP